MVHRVAHEEEIHRFRQFRIGRAGHDRLDGGDAGGPGLLRHDGKQSRVDIDRVDLAGRSGSLGERQREDPGAGAEIRNAHPRCDAECGDDAVYLQRGDAVGIFKCLLVLLRIALLRGETGDNRNRGRKGRDGPS
jgi:hypothetical protein